MIRILSESAADIDTYLYGASLLCKSAAHCFKVESLIVLIECIVDPESHLTVSFVEADTSVQCSVKSLADIVLFCPINASRCPISCIDCNVVQKTVFLQSKNIFSPYGKGMFRNERYIMSVVAYFLLLSVDPFFGYIVGKGCIGITVVTVEAERICDLCP